MSNDLPPTPEGQLLRRARELVIPKLAIRAAAARIGMSAEQWGYAERGYTPGRGDRAPQPFRPPAATLARMARALDLTPERLETEGQRPDAAEVLREILRNEQPPLRPVPAPPAAALYPGGDISDSDTESAAATELVRLLADHPDDRILAMIAVRGGASAKTRLAEARGWLGVQADIQRNGTNG